MQVIEHVSWQLKPFNDLSGVEVEAIFQLRQAVFIIEQNCTYPDIDGQDGEALHLMGWLHGQLIATLRLFPEYPPYEGRCSVGRVCTQRDYRRDGIGRALMQQAVDYIDQHHGHQQTQIGAQLYLTRFYESFGFHPCSEPYDEDGITHILMRRAASRSHSSQIEQS